MHQHRRAGDIDDGRPHRVANFVESVPAKGIGRLYGPAVLTAMLGVVSFVGVRAINWMATTSKDIDTVKSDIRDLNTRFNESALRRIDDGAADNRRQDAELQTLREQVAVLRSAVKTP